jgi:hypothetical protein
MSRTQGRYDADTPHTDGHVFVSALDGTLTSGTGTPTRVGSGLYTLAIGNTQTAVLQIPLTSLIFRFGEQDSLQEQFGSAAAQGATGVPVNGYTTQTTASVSAGANVSIAVKNSAGFVIGRTITLDLYGTPEYPKIVSFPDSTHILVNQVTATHASGVTISENLFTTPAGVSGSPPYTGSSELTPVTSPRPKGITIKQIYPIYTVGTVALTTNTIGVTKTVFAPNTAPVVTNLLADAANGLATAVQANPYLTPIQLTQPVSMLTTKYASYTIEWDVTTAGTGTANLYGVFLDISFNYN